MKSLRQLLPLLAAAGLLAQDAGPDAVPESVDATAPAKDTPPSAEAEPSADDDIIPRPFETARYETSWAKNPFLLKTIVTNQATASFAQDWALAGMYRSPSGKITVTLQNKQTNEYQRVSSDKTDGEFQLVEAKFNRNRNEASVVVSRGSQTAELKYDDTLVSKPVTINNTLLKAEGGQPGQPAAAAKPGTPVSATTTRPGTPVPRAGSTAAPAVTPPSISRRRQLIPPPTVTPKTAP